MKEKLLYLCHRIPFPANKGDKIATCNILKFLNQHYDVYLGCFIDDPFDNQYRHNVREYCKEAFFVELNPLKAKFKGLSAFITGKPITLPYFHSKKMQEWVDNVVQDNSIDKAFIYSGCMAQYVLNPSMTNMHKVMHFCDVDSDKWNQYADKKQGVMRWVFKREHKTLEAYEKFVASKFAISCFISDKEKAMFCALAPEVPNDKVHTLSNGIDTDFFSPQAQQDYKENYPLKSENYIVFTGVMDYWANVDAVTWFAQSVWPNVRKQLPDSQFYIVGSSPSKQVSNLGDIPGIVVTGRVEDVRPYLSNAKACVAPLQIARGIQNKVLEAMAMELPVSTTSLGIEGIEDYPEDDVFVSDSASDTEKWVINKLTSDATAASKSRNWLIQHYGWEAKLSPLLDYLGKAND